MAKDTRKRLQIRFWLNDGKPSESKIGQWLDTLRAKRKQKPTILKALTLYKALLSDDTHLLKKEFPSVVKKLESEREDKKDGNFGQEFVALMTRQTQIMTALSERLS